MAANSVAKLLRASAELLPLQERLDQIQRLQRRYRSVAPGELAKASRVCAIEGTTVVICASSGPVAAALRQVAPRILTELRKSNSLKENENPELTGIRVEVQVERRPVRRAVKSRGPMPVDTLSKVADGLADSPLKDTLERIGGRGQSSKTREKT
jgi:hypothetical protein